MSATGTATLPRAGRLRIEPAPLLWAAALVGTAVCLALRGTHPWLVRYPAAWLVPFAAWIDWAAAIATTLLAPSCRALGWALGQPMRGAQLVLLFLPWPAGIALAAALAQRASGWKLATFTVLALGYVVVAGYWTQSMNTLSLVVVAVPLSVLLGFALGAAAYAVAALRRPVVALLDLMQTIPAFAYLIPLLLLFGFGAVAGLVSAVIFAVPPMVRCTLLGLQQVPPHLLEAGTMAGCTGRQRFVHVSLPSAMPQLLIGVNQTTMAALSMVIIAAIIGGFDDVGWAVLSSMRKAEFGQSLLSGMVIALLAMLIDRITLGLARPAPPGGRSTRPVHALLAVAAAAIVARLALPAGTAWLAAPHGLVDVGAINDAVFAVVRNHADVFEGIKNTVLYFVILPLRLGLVGAVSPFTWGFDLTPPMILGYSAVVVVLAALLTTRFGWRAGVAAIVAGGFVYFGFSGFPWPAFILLLALLAREAGGARVAALAVAGAGFVLVGGLWPQLMLSLYLCGLAVVLCVLAGGALGIWAASSDRVSAMLRPVSDTLQTMPQFVFLIPALMLFKVGEFTALIAIMLYAIVPPIRYVEAGLRQVRPDIVEAARQIGCTNSQLLWRVKLPLAMPLVMLGVNQTIMAGLSMLAVAAMVGTKDLGQEVYIALSRADAGQGLVAGLSIALVAIVADRIIRAWADRRQAALT